MGRSVAVAANATATHILHLPADLDPDFGWDDFVEDVRNVLQERYPSLTPCDRWVGRETQGILENDHALVVISEYCGVVSLSIGPTDRGEQTNIGRGWLANVAKSFNRHLRKRFPESTLVPIGTASNGETFYRTAGHDTIVERGERLGF